MNALFSGLYQRFETIYGDMIKAVDGLPVEALDWVPGQDMNSLCVLVVHTVGANRYWARTMVFGETSDRDRAAEFRAEGYTAMQLIAMIHDHLAEIKTTLAKLTFDDLETTYVSEKHRNESFTVGWSLMHALEHAGLHTGHAQITRQLWDQRQAG